jgi:uncharacterized damage-inducible protein DinB
MPLRLPPPSPSWTVLLLVLAAAACAGEGPPRAGAGEWIVEDWERQRETVLRYVEAMPEENLGFLPTPGVRTFAEQIEHIVTDHVAIVATAFGLSRRPDLGDPDEYLTSQEALLEHVRSGFDFVLEVVRDASEGDLRAEGDVFGRYRVPRWKALDGALEHGTWTLGQVVPYLRLAGQTPPPYQVFPLSRQVEGWTPPGEGESD